MSTVEPLIVTLAFGGLARKETVWFAIRSEEEYLWLAHEAIPMAIPMAISNTIEYLIRPLLIRFCIRLTFVTMVSMLSVKTVHGKKKNILLACHFEVQIKEPKVTR